MPFSPVILCGVGGFGDLKRTTVLWISVMQFLAATQRCKSMMEFSECVLSIPNIGRQIKHIKTLAFATRARSACTLLRVNELHCRTFYNPKLKKCGRGRLVDPAQRDAVDAEGTSPFRARSRALDHKERDLKERGTEA